MEFFQKNFFSFAGSLKHSVRIRVISQDTRILFRKVGGSFSLHATVCLVGWLVRISYLQELNSSQALLVTGGHKGTCFLTVGTGHFPGTCFLEQLLDCFIELKAWYCGCSVWSMVPPSLFLRLSGFPGPTCKHQISSRLLLLSACSQGDLAKEKIALKKIFLKT